ncbi:YggT family protein [Sphingoaurantiacus capsulatus]|uniref:YggT family protein n=1 Tax=Sphingoaurantiacus capsulatus TaxID=1771310 RepID=A0ABV7XEX3_9SPHN
MLISLIGFLMMLITLLIWIVVAQAIMSWLVAFNVVNTHNQFVRTVLTFLDRLVDPLVRPIRRFMPDLGGIDLSSAVLVIALIFVRDVLLGGLLVGGL